MGGAKARSAAGRLACTPRLSGQRACRDAVRSVRIYQQKGFMSGMPEDYPAIQWVFCSHRRGLVKFDPFLEFVRPEPRVWRKIGRPKSGGSVPLRS
jgi:hypothetical protein